MIFDDFNLTSCPFTPPFSPSHVPGPSCQRRTKRRALTLKEAEDKLNAEEADEDMFEFKLNKLKIMNIRCLLWYRTT